MQVVIDIPDETYNQIIEESKLSPRNLDYFERRIAKGTPLPKGHGDLKDADKIANEVNALKDNWDRYGNEYESGRYESYDYAVDMINDAPTIIEADKAESEDKK